VLHGLHRLHTLLKVYRHAGWCINRVLEYNIPRLRRKAVLGELHARHNGIPQFQEADAA
jgi:hypothetical protein